VLLLKELTAALTRVLVLVGGIEDKSCFFPIIVVASWYSTKDEREH